MYKLVENAYELITVQEPFSIDQLYFKGDFPCYLILTILKF